MFSNFAATPITMNGRVYATTEHYFQAMKFEHSTADFDAVANTNTAREAAKEGRKGSRPLRPDWHQVKDKIMFDAIMAKAIQHPDILQLLMDSGDATLVERTKNDSYWGDGGDGSGRNMLGITLMNVRQKLREVPPPPVEAQMGFPLDHHPSFLLMAHDELRRGCHIFATNHIARC